jgi:hypothetical protein
MGNHFQSLPGLLSAGKCELGLVRMASYLLVGVSIGWLRMNLFRATFPTIPAGKGASEFGLSQRDPRAANYVHELLPAGERVSLGWLIWNTFRASTACLVPAGEG